MKICSLTISILTPAVLPLFEFFADTVEAYESGKLAKLLNIGVKDDL